MASSFSTMVNCAVWAMNCELSTGSIGFWYLSWATSSLRNMSLPLICGSVWVVAPSVGPVTVDGVVADAIRPATLVIASMLTGATFAPTATDRAVRRRPGGAGGRGRAGTGSQHGR